MPMPSRLATPLSLYEEYMQAQGLDVADRDRMGLVLLDTLNAQKQLGYQIFQPSVLLPYPGEEQYKRVRVLGPSKSKYLSPKGSGSGPVYLPPWEHIDWADIRADAGQMVCIVEGEIKAYWGCRPALGGPVCVGIGGVNMTAQLFDSGWEWRGRKVVVAFDKDQGWESGTWKPAVATSLGKLCSRLAAEGASVWVLQLPGEVGDKVGLDDYLRGGGSWQALLDTAVAPPEWCEVLSDMLEKCVFVYGTNHTHVYHVENGSRKSLDDFHTTYANKRRRLESGKSVPISKIWEFHDQRVSVENYCMNPLLGRGVVGRMYNLWEPFPSWDEYLTEEDTRGVVEDWERFMEGLFGAYWRWVAAWVGHMLERPEEPSTQAVMLVTSVQGIGKSLFGDICRDVTGVHGLECGVERMFSKFNAEMEGRVFVMVNELDVKFSAREGQLNDLLTAEKIYVEQKGKDVIEFPNLRRWYLTTNSASPCRLSRGQRRVLVISPPRVSADTRGEWGKWVGGTIASYRRSAGALAAISGWFRDALRGWEEEHGSGGRWNPKAPVPETAEAEELALASRTGTQILADEATEWIIEKGRGALAPIRKKTDAKLVGEIIMRVRAAGGLICSKLVKHDGAVLRYTTFEWRSAGDPLEYDAARCIKSELDAVEVRKLDEDLWMMVFGLKTTIGGG